MFMVRKSQKNSTTEQIFIKMPVYLQKQKTNEGVANE